MATLFTPIFVYGTLRPGQPNHRLLGRSEWLGTFRTTPRFTLADLGAFPAMIDGGDTSVIGDLFAVDRETLRALDYLEGHPRFYRRQAIPLENGQMAQAYLLPADQATGRPRIAGGDWVEHRTRTRI
jgi:gamma-glutamylaminecyclotransferase